MFLSDKAKEVYNQEKQKIAACDLRATKKYLDVYLGHIVSDPEPKNENEFKNRIARCCNVWDDIAKENHSKIFKVGGLFEFLQHGVFER